RLPAAPLPPLALHSFPTRRTSDLRQAERARSRQRIGEDRPPRLVALAHAEEIERSYGAVMRLIVVVAVVVAGRAARVLPADPVRDRKSTRLNSSHVKISYAVCCLK